jgi:hypothetical protein
MILRLPAGLPNGDGAMRISTLFQILGKSAAKPKDFSMLQTGCSINRSIEI